MCAGREAALSGRAAAPRGITRFWRAYGWGEKGGGVLQRQLYLKNAAIMTATSLVLRAAGMVFRVYIAARIGAQGMGVYQLVTTVYALAVTLGTAGLSVAATRVCTDLMAGGRAGLVRGALRRMLALALCAGAAAGAVLFAGAGAAARWWLGDVRAAAALRILAPSLPFMALSACMRGYFMARRSVSQGARAQLLEQVVRIGVVAALLGRVPAGDTAAACMAVVAGNTVSEAVSWAYLAACCRRDARALPDGGAPAGLGRTLWGILAPIAANQYVSSALHTAENVLAPACLAVFLGSRDTALAQYGALKGMALPVLFFPFSLLGTLSALLMPEIAQAHVQNRRGALRRLVERVLLLTMTLSLLAGALFTLLARDIGQVLYQSGEIGFYLRILGPLAPFMYLESMVDGMLKGLNEQMSTFRYTVLDSCARIALTALLLPRAGMKGFLFVMLVSNLTTCLLNLHRLLHVTGVRFRLGKWLAGPAACAAASAAAAGLALGPLRTALPQAVWAVCAGAAAACAYGALLYLTGCVRRGDFATAGKAKK